MSRSYIDTFFCEICEEDTVHSVYDAEHERDSSNDYRICRCCGSRWSGYTGEYEPPHTIGPDTNGSDY
jgi:hypothetical protein